TVGSQWVEGALAATAAAGAGQVAVTSAAGMGVGYQVGVWLDAGRTFWATVSAVGGGMLTLSAALPSQATSGARVVAYPAALVRPLRVPGARRYHFAPPGGQAIETPLVPMSRLDYANVPNKTTPGMVTQFFYDPQLGAGVMQVWPAPCDNGCALKFTAQRPLAVFSGLASVPDFPDEWLAAMRWNLAAELWPEFNGAGNTGQYAVLKQEAVARLMTAQAWDREPQSVLFGAGAGPAGRSG
ncbi:phage adaptor protein, partial [Gluconacetobacter azotocaptans]